MNKAVSVLCKCVNKVYCVCKDIVVPSKSVQEYPFNDRDLKEWQRAEGMNQHTKHKY